MKVTKSSSSIQRQWDLIICRAIYKRTRLKEAYYMSAEFSCGESFKGSVEELHRFVVGLDLKRLVENTSITKCSGKRDLTKGIFDHCEQLGRDIREHGSAVAYIGIEDYKWKSLVPKRVMMKESVKNRSNSHSYSSGSGFSSNCSDWKTVK